MLKSVVLATALALAAATSAPAAVVSWIATLDQAQEVPTPISVPGATGEGKGTLNTVSGLLKWKITWAGLSGAPRGLHFHAPAAVGATAPVVVDVGALSGLVSPSKGSATLSSAGVTDFLAGLYYINIHTNLNRPGEIRGQVVVPPVPLPAAAGLLLAGVGALAGLGLARKRRATAA